MSIGIKEVTKRWTGMFVNEKIAFLRSQEHMGKPLREDQLKILADLGKNGKLNSKHLYICSNPKCKNWFERYPRKTADAVYCSNHCKCKAREDCRRSERRAERRYRCMFRGCRKWFERDAWLVNHKQKVYCSNDCKYKARETRVSVRCSYCKRRVMRIKYTTKGKKVFLCGSLCHSLYQSQARARRLTYSPSFLQSLKEDRVLHCPFPECEKERAPIGIMNPWGLCKEHGYKVFNALRSRKRRRNKILYTEGLA